MKTEKELLEARKQVFERAEAFAKQEDLTDEETRSFDTDLAELETLDSQIEAARGSEKRAHRFATLQRGDVPATPTPRGPEPGAAERRSDPVDHPDSEKYSMLRAIRCISRNQPVDGYEGEISQEIAQRTGKDPQGFFMPNTLGVRSLSGSRETRDFNVSAAAGAIDTKLSTSMIDLLRNRTKIFQLGANLMTGLEGIVDIPKLTGATTGYWVGEATAVTEAAQTVGKVTLTPTTLGAFTDVTRRLVAQTSIDMENLVRNDILRVLSIELDRACVNGSGSGAEPEGILQDSNIATIAVGTNGGALTRDLVLQMERDVAVNNADVGTLHYLTNPKVRKSAKLIDSGTDTGNFLWTDGELEGYPAHVTNQVPSTLTKGTGSALSALIYGDFSTVMVGFWTGLDVMVDPYSLSTQGDIRIIALQDCDVDFRHDESLVKIVDIATT